MQKEIKNRVLRWQLRMDSTVFLRYPKMKTVSAQNNSLFISYFSPILRNNTLKYASYLKAIDIFLFPIKLDMIEIKYEGTVF